MHGMTMLLTPTSVEAFAQLQINVFLLFFLFLDLLLFLYNLMIHAVILVTVRSV